MGFSHYKKSLWSSNSVLSSVKNGKFPIFLCHFLHPVYQSYCLSLNTKMYFSPLFSMNYFIGHVLLSYSHSPHSCHSGNYAHFKDDLNAVRLRAGKGHIILSPTHFYLTVITALSVRTSLLSLPLKGECKITPLNKENHCKKSLALRGKALIEHDPNRISAA